MLRKTLNYNISSIAKLKSYVVDIWGVICVKIIKSNMPIFMQNRNANISIKHNMDASNDIFIIYQDQDACFYEYRCVMLHNIV